MMKFKDRIKELREEKGISQQAVADSIFVSRSAVAKWENGLGLPSKESLRLLSEFYHIEESELLKEQLYEKELISKNIKIKRMKLSIVLSCGMIAVLVVLMIVLGYMNKLTSNHHLLYNSIPVVTVNNEEITYSEIASEYKVDNNGDLRRYDYVMNFPSIQAYDTMDLFNASETYQIKVANTSNIIGEYYYLNEDYNFAEQSSGWTLVQLHDLVIDNNGVFHFEETSYPYIVVVLYVEYPDLSVNYHFVIDLR